VSEQVDTYYTDYDARMQAAGRTRTSSQELISAFMKSKIAKSVLDRAKAIYSPKPKKDKKEPFQDTSESMVKKLVSGSISIESAIVEVAQFFDPNQTSIEGNYQPTLQEYIDALLIITNQLNINEYFIGVEPVPEFELFFSFYDASMSPTYAEELLKALNDGRIPFNNVIQAPQLRDNKPVSSAPYVICSSIQSIEKPE